MKKIIFTILLFIPILSMAIEKSGVKEYDSLNLSSGGRIIAYFDDKKKIVDEPYAMFYRKEFKKLNNSHLVADFFADTDTPEKIFLLKDLDDENSINGKLAFFNKDGSLAYVADMKNGKIAGQKISYNNGEIVAIINFTDNLANGKGTLFYKNKKYAESNYAHGFIHGEFTLFYPDGSKVLTQNYVDNDIVSTKNINYRLQKSGIDEYDNLDFTQGDIIHYYDIDGNIISKNSKSAYFFRKLVSEDSGVYLVVDFFVDSGNVQGVGKGYNLKDFQGYTLEGPVITYYDNGNLKSKGFYKDKKLDGEYVQYNYNGEPSRIDIYENGQIKSGTFLDR